MTITVNYGDGLVAAGDLTVEHIGHAFRWRKYDEQYNVVTVTTAELRQINHDSTGTQIVYGNGANLEESFEHDEPLLRYPRDDYRDMPTLLNAHDTWKDES